MIQINQMWGRGRRPWGRAFLPFFLGVVFGAVWGGEDPFLTAAPEERGDHGCGPGRKGRGLGRVITQK